MAKRKGGRSVSGPATDAGSGWWLLGGLAVVGGIVAAVIWSQSKPAAKPVATVRRNGGGVPLAPAVDMAALRAAEEASARELDRLAIERMERAGQQSREVEQFQAAMQARPGLTYDQWVQEGRPSATAQGLRW